MSFCEEHKYDVDGKGHGTVRKEISRLLEVTGAQIDMAMFDGYKSVDVLTDLISEMGSLSLKMRELIEADESASKSDYEKHISLLENCTNKALKEFQFYDLLSQRIDHGVNSVDMLSKYLSTNYDSGCDENWHKFRESISDRFSLESEKKLFHLMMSGASAEEALDVLSSQPNNEKLIDVELF